MIPEQIQFRNSNKHRKPLIQQSQGPEPMSIEPPYPQQQVYNQPHQNYQPNYPSQNFNEMGFQQHSGFQQQYSNTSYQHQQNYYQNGPFSTGNTGNFYNPNFNQGYNPQMNYNPQYHSNGPYQNNHFQGNPTYPTQGQGFVGNQGSQGQGNPILGANFNPLDLIGRRM